MAGRLLEREAETAALLDAVRAASRAKAGSSCCPVRRVPGRRPDSRAARPCDEHNLTPVYEAVLDLVHAGRARLAATPG